MFNTTTVQQVYIGRCILNNPDTKIDFMLQANIVKLRVKRQN